MTYFTLTFVAPLLVLFSFNLVWENMPHSVHKVKAPNVVLSSLGFALKNMTKCAHDFLCIVSIETVLTLQILVSVSLHL